LKNNRDEGFFVKKVPLWYPFVLAAIFAIYGQIFFPWIKLLSFAPFLAISFYRICFVRSLWLAFLCGLVIDTISSQMHYGLIGLCTCLTAAICYPQKKHFFEDKAIALSLFTALISSVYSLCLFVLTLLFDRQITITGSIVVSEALITPIFDAVYALLWFTVPIRLYLYIASGAWKKYLKKEQQEEPE
jgi:hypothetical protein